MKIKFSDKNYNRFSNYNECREPVLSKEETFCMPIYLNSKWNTPLLNPYNQSDLESLYLENQYKNNINFDTLEYKNISTKFAIKSIKLTKEYAKNPSDKKVGYQFLKNILDFEKETLKICSKEFNRLYSFSGNIN